MNLTRKDEERYLDKDERELVARTHQPELGGVEDKELADLKKRVRERRDRARDIASRQRREMRGKARPQGQEGVRDDAGSKVKLAVLAHAMKRVNAESARRARKDGRQAMVEGLRESLARKRAATSDRPKSRTAGKGMKANPNTVREQIADPREVGRVSQSQKKAQARRDSK
jgi:hypothetical protein